MTINGDRWVYELAYLAYRQPVERGSIASIAAVNTDGATQKALAHGRPRPTKLDTWVWVWIVAPVMLIARDCLHHHRQSG